MTTSEGLDEAAEKIYPPGINDTLRTAFKAGAEWQASQGVSLTITEDTTWREIDSFVHRNVDGANQIRLWKK